MNQTETMQIKHVIFLRWLARITGSLFFILFAMLFVEDGLPVYMFQDDPLHMTALGISLIGLLIGWKSDLWAGVIVLMGTFADWLIVSIQSGIIMTNMGPLVSFFPFIGLIYLYCWWRSKKTV